MHDVQKEASFTHMSVFYPAYINGTMYMYTTKINRNTVVVPELI